jgi:hypothetical protein
LQLWPKKSIDDGGIECLAHGFVTRRSGDKVKGTAPPAADLTPGRRRCSIMDRFEVLKRRLAGSLTRLEFRKRFPSIALQNTEDENVWPMPLAFFHS